MFIKKEKKIIPLYVGTGLEDRVLVHFKTASTIRYLETKFPVNNIKFESVELKVLYDAIVDSSEIGFIKLNEGKTEIESRILEAVLIRAGKK